MMNRNYVLLSLLVSGLLMVSACKRDTIYGDIDPNTDRMIVEFAEANTVHSIAVDYATTVITVDLADLRFMLRSFVQNDVTVKLISNPGIVYDYNDNNGTVYIPVPSSLFSFESDEIVLSAAERKKKVRIRIKPSDIASGQYAIGLSIAQVSSGEVSQIAGKILITIAVKNKYDGVYHLKGFYTRTDFPDYNGPFETDVAMVTTGPNSVAMYWIDGGGYAQPFWDAGANDFTAFGNVDPEAFFNAADQVTSVNNYTGDPAAGPFMTAFPGANSRYVPGPTPVIYLKYYYNTNPANRIFADTLTYTGPR